MHSVAERPKPEVVENNIKLSLSLNILTN